MTVIAAIALGKKGVWMAADRISAYGDNQFRSRPKIYTRGAVMWGGSGTAVLLRAAANAEFEQPPARKVDEWVEGVFVPAIRLATKQTSVSEEWISFLVGVRGRLFLVDSGYGVSEHKVFAVGSGGEMAIGAMDASRSTPKDRVKNAVSVCCKRLTTCAGPVQVEHV